MCGAAGVGSAVALAGVEAAVAEEAEESTAAVPPTCSVRGAASVGAAVAAAGVEAAVASAGVEAAITEETEESAAAVPPPRSERAGGAPGALSVLPPPNKSKGLRSFGRRCASAFPSTFAYCEFLRPTRGGGGAIAPPAKTDPARGEDGAFHDVSAPPPPFARRPRAGDDDESRRKTFFSAVSRSDLKSDARSRAGGEDDDACEPVLRVLTVSGARVTPFTRAAVVERPGSGGGTPNWPWGDVT